MIEMNKVICILLILSAVICILYFHNRPPLKEVELKKQAAKEKVPFRIKEWYNCRVYVKGDEYTFIECIDKNGNYIACPNVGGELIYNIEGRRYRYKVVGFQNESQNRDWLYSSDCIYPIIEYVGKVEE